MKIERMLLLQYESIFSRGLSKIPNQMDFFPLDFDVVWKKQSSTLRHIHFRSLPYFCHPVNVEASSSLVIPIFLTCFLKQTSKEM